jgi:enolase-phosphatase E1
MAVPAAIVTDIEGTTSSIAYVKDVLFPYARSRLRDFIDQHPHDVAPILEEARQLHGDPSLSAKEVADLLDRWAGEDRKIAPLKTLQGMIWAEGYASGALTGHIYPDAAAALRRWRAAGIRLYVYSSGSVEAQKLLFGHTAFGDLTPLFSGYFDTRVGGKLETASYAKIAATIGFPPSELLFLSDHAGEIAAAAGAGWDVQLIDRDGLTPRAASSMEGVVGVAT